MIQKEVKEKIIKELENLIEEIKTDEATDDYVFKYEVFERFEDECSVTNLERFSIERRKFYFKAI